METLESIFSGVPTVNEPTAVESRLDRLKQDDRQLKLTVGALLLSLAAVPLVGAAVPQQDLTERFLLLATARTGTMQRELDEVAAEGFRLLPATMISKTGFFGDQEIVMVMEKSPNSSRRYQYMLLATVFTSTLQAEMAQAVAYGYEVVGMVSRDEHIVILERSNDGR